MSWMQRLYETYESCAGNKNVPDSDNLCPVGYSIQNAHVEIVIDYNGNFKRASLVPKDNLKTLIPVTEKSLTGRTSGIAPHGLCESIQYCAGDYTKHGGEKESYFDRCEFNKTEFDDNGYEPLEFLNAILKDEDKAIISKMKKDICIETLNAKLLELNENEIKDVNDRIHFNRSLFEKKYSSLCPQNNASYLLQLERWVNSEYNHPKAEAVYKYVKKKQVVENLIREGILLISEGKLIVEKKGDGKNDNNKKTEKSNSIMKMLQYDENTGLKDQAKAFIRWTVEGDNDLVTHTWEDKSLFNSWQRFSDSFNSKEGFCYVTGCNTILSQKHPAKLRNSKDGAKLISSNDMTGYTFLGRFTNSEQAAGVSSEVSQKAHSALRWLIERKQSFKNGDQVIVTWATKGTGTPDPLSNTFEFLGEQEDLNTSNDSGIGDVGQSFAIRFNKKISGYKSTITDMDNIIVMGLDSASKGRLSITFYRELIGTEFLKRIENWHKEFEWEQNFGKDLHFPGAPSPKDIAWAAYGKKIEGKSGGKLLGATVERVLPCIIDGAKVPKDLVVSCIHRVSNRIAMERWEWEKCLGIACSLYRGANKEKEYSMELEVERKTRDYLYGCLLAVGEKIESKALSFAKENRDTAAARYMQRFSDRPFSTWRLIENSLVPYMSRINSRMPGLLAGYKELLDEIHSSFIGNDYTVDKPLSGEYLLGYHCQRKWLREHKRKDGKWIKKDQLDNETQETDYEE